MLATRALTHPRDAKSFLKELLALQYRGADAVNLADFSRRAGFRSRSYLSELFSGKKGFSSESVRKLKQALRVPSPLADVFELLVWREWPDLRPRRLGGAETEEALDRLLLKIRTQDRGSAGADTIKDRVSKGVRNLDLLKVYAALGSIHQGASLKEIFDRLAKMPSYRVTTALTKLCALELSKFKEGRYYALESTVDVLGMRDSSQGLAQLLDDNLKILAKQTQPMVEDPHGLVHVTSFSISSDRIEEFKQACLSTLLNVIDKHQSDQGDQIMTLQTVGYTEQLKSKSLDP